MNGLSTFGNGKCYDFGRCEAACEERQRREHERLSRLPVKVVVEDRARLIRDRAHVTRQGRKLEVVT